MGRLAAPQARSLRRLATRLGSGRPEPRRRARRVSRRLGDGNESHLLGNGTHYRPNAGTILLIGARREFRGRGASRLVALDLVQNATRRNGIATCLRMQVGSCRSGSVDAKALISASLISVRAWWLAGLNGLAAAGWVCERWRARAWLMDKARLDGG
eukprot:6188565-Pleurochrysis_carterae.AAC.1